MRASTAAKGICVVGFLAAVILYGIAIGGPTSVFPGLSIELFTNGTEAISLYLGYVGACVSLPESVPASLPSSPNATNMTSELYCTMNLDVPTDDLPQLADVLIANMDLPFDPIAAYTSSLISVLDAAGLLRKTIFAWRELITACSFFAAAGLLLILLWIASYVRHRRASKNGGHAAGAPDAMTITTVGAMTLFLAFGFMAASATTFALSHGLAMLKVVGEVPVAGGIEAETETGAARAGAVFAKSNGKLLKLLIGGLAAGGIFITAFTIAAGASAARARDDYSYGDVNATIMQQQIQGYGPQPRGPSGRSGRPQGKSGLKLGNLAKFGRGRRAR